MKLYCMCREKNNKPDGQVFRAPNLFAPYDKDTDFRALVLHSPMEVMKIGAKQVLLKNRKQVNDWTEDSYIGDKDILKQHYPNVDVFRCCHCGVMIVRE